MRSSQNRWVRNRLHLIFEWMKRLISCETLFQIVNGSADDSLIGYSLRLPSNGLLQFLVKRLENDTLSFCIQINPHLSFLLVFARNVRKRFVYPERLYK